VKQYLTLSEELKLKVFENRVLIRRMFGPKRGEGTGKWRKVRSEELHTFYTSQLIKTIKSRAMRWVGHIAHGRNEKYIQNFS
jgi:hypothetical protein